MDTPSIILHIEANVKMLTDRQTRDRQTDG